MKKMARKMKKYLAETSDHRYALLVIVYVVIVWWAVYGVPADMPGRNQFWRGHSPANVQLQVFSQQPSKGGH